MSFRRFVLPVAFALVSGLTSTSHARALRTIDTEQGLAARIAGDSVILEVPDGYSPSIQDLVAACEAVTEDRFLLAAPKVGQRGLPIVGRHVITTARFFGFFQDCLRLADLYLLPITAANESGSGRTFAIVSTQETNKPGYLKSNAPSISAEQVRSHADDSALIFTCTFELRNVSSQEATNLLNAYFTDPQIESVRAIATSNALVCTGTGSTLAQLADMISRLDVPAKRAERTTIVIPLKHSEAGAVQRQVRTHLSQRGPIVMAQGMPNVESSASITIDARTNSVIVTGTAEQNAEIRGVVAAFDVEPSDPIETRVIRLSHGNAIEIADVLRHLTTPQGETASSDDAEGSRGVDTTSLAIHFVASSNSLVVRAPRSKLEEIGNWVAALDVEVK